MVCRGKCVSAEKVDRIANKVRKIVTNAFLKYPYPNLFLFVTPIANFTEDFKESASSND
jgi:hypothetical protein